MNRSRILTAIALAGAVALMGPSAFAKDRTKGRGAPGSPIVYVTSQDLFYDSIVLADLPFNDTGNFQLLEMSGPTGLQTEFGPTDTGYYGGRWWVDANPNGFMDEQDVFFLCPLLGPGRLDP